MANGFSSRAPRVPRRAGSPRTRPSIREGPPLGCGRSRSPRAASRPGPRSGTAERPQERRPRAAMGCRSSRAICERPRAASPQRPRDRRPPTPHPRATRRGRVRCRASASPRLARARAAAARAASELPCASARRPCARPRSACKSPVEPRVLRHQRTGLLQPALRGRLIAASERARWRAPAPSSLARPVELDPRLRVRAPSRPTCRPASGRRAPAP